MALNIYLRKGLSLKSMRKSVVLVRSSARRKKEVSRGSQLTAQAAPEHSTGIFILNKSQLACTLVPILSFLVPSTAPAYAEETPFVGGSFRVVLRLGSEFPAAPPKGRFMTKIFHPNVSPEGEICVNTLKRDWKPEHTLAHVLQVIRCLLIVPFPESSLNEEAGKLFMESYDEYTKRATLLTQVHAVSGAARRKAARAGKTKGKGEGEGSSSGAGSRAGAASGGAGGGASAPTASVAPSAPKGKPGPGAGAGAGAGRIAAASEASGAAAKKAASSSSSRRAAGGPLSDVRGSVAGTAGTGKRASKKASGKSAGAGVKADRPSKKKSKKGLKRL